MVLDVLADQREKIVLSYNSTGQVRENQLRIRFRFRLRTLGGKELIPDTEILQQRDVTFNETIALSKEAEEALLYRDMQTDIVQQMLRFSTNITAETVGLAASGAGSLAVSAATVQAWAKARLGLDATLLDHSGLGAASRVTAGGMMRALLAGDRALGLRPVLRNIGMRD